MFISHNSAKLKLQIPFYQNCFKLKVAIIMKVPVVDLGVLGLNASTPSEKDWTTSAESLRTALKEIGFVYLINHGVSEQKVERLFHESARFFDLPIETKITFNRDFGTTFHGYTKVGGERMTLDTKIELREMFDVALAEEDEFSKCPYPDQEVPQFKSAARDLIDETKSLVCLVLKLLAKALNIDDENHFLSLHKNIGDSSIPNYTQLRTLLYPQIADSTKITPGVVRCAEHTDYGTFTFLFQDSMGGLQIKSVNGDWIPANPIPGSILMNVGDLLEIWSGGMFPSSVHRVIVPEDEIKKRTCRQSIALFVKPDNNTLVQPLVPSIKNQKFGKDEKHSILAGEHFRKRTIYHRHIADPAEA